MKWKAVPNIAHPCAWASLTPLTRIRWIWASVALLLCNCAETALRAPVERPRDDALVYVIKRGWHTDIGLSVEEVSGPLATLERPFPGVRFLTFGFGERRFLTTRRSTAIGMLTALFPSRSALLMTALKTDPATGFGQPTIVVLRIYRDGLRQIETLIWAELEQPPAATPVALAERPYPGSVFYPPTRPMTASTPATHGRPRSCAPAACRCRPPACRS